MTFVKIPQYPDYLINEEGQVLSTKSGNILTEHTQSSGYKYYSFYVDGKNKNFMTHRLLCHTFKGMDLFDESLEVDHEDRCKSNNALDNLKVLSKQNHILKTLKDKGYHIKQLCQCGNQKVQRQQCCITCWSRANPLKAAELTQVDIEVQVQHNGWVQAGRLFGMSDNGLRKRYFKLSGKDPKTLKKL